MTGEAPESVLDTALLHGEPDSDQTPERVLQFAISAVGADGAALMLMYRGGKAETVAATADDIEAVDSLQLKLGDGPCLSTLLVDRDDVIDDTATDTRWPTWGSRAAQLGYRSVLCMQLRDSSGTAGALNLYARAIAAFDDDDRAVGHVLARHVSIALQNARHMSQLYTAVDARKLIGQAQGILMERYSLDADQAFAVLRRYSQHSNVKLRVVAQQLIATRQLPEGG